MRGLKRLKQKIYHSKIIEELDGIDTDIIYSKPMPYKFSVSATAGTPEELAAGVVPTYDRYITSFDRTFNPEEGDVFWVDAVPELDTNGELITEDNIPTVMPDYRLKKILDTAKGKVARYGISKIGAENE